MNLIPHSMSNKDAEIEELLKLRAKCERFRILIIGRANAGKTTICQKMCNTADPPIIHDRRGNVIHVSPTTKRGVHDINAEITFRSNPGFVFHDSCGMESGSVIERDTVVRFINARGKTTDLQSQLHAIWFCIPMDDNRPLLESEKSFFMEERPQVPVILIFTKCDALETKYFEWYGETDIEVQMNLARQQGAEELQRLKKIVMASSEPPNAVVELYDMHQPEGNDQPCTGATVLVDQTAECMDVTVLRMLFMSVQSNSLELCAKYAIRDFIKTGMHRDTSSVLKREQLFLRWYPLHRHEELDLDHLVDRDLLLVVFDEFHHVHDGLPTLSESRDDSLSKRGRIDHAIRILCIAHLSSFCPGDTAAVRLVAAKAQFYKSKATQLSESIPHDKALNLMSDVQLKEHMHSLFNAHKMIAYNA